MAALCGLAVAWWAASCNGKRPGAKNPGDTTTPPPFPTGEFQPGQRLADPLPAAPDKPGLSYLQTLHDTFGTQWQGFLEDCRLRLPPGHPLNQSTLAVRLELTIARDGALRNMTVIAPSGNPEFDGVATEIVRESAPFAEPPGDAISDDDGVHVVWLFARDRRQAGVATAELRRVEWPPERSVPKFLAQGDVTLAAARLASAAGGDQGGKPYLELGQQIAAAAIRNALRHEDVNVKRVGVSAARTANLLAAAPELRTIVNTSVDVSLRGEAIATLGAIGDPEAAPLLVEIMETAKGSGVGGAADNSGAAAQALAALGKRDVAEAKVLGWLNESDNASQWAALVVMSEFSVPTAVSTLASMVRDEAQTRAVRLAACTALGTATTRAVAQAGMNALRQGFAAKDAGMRAACAAAVARAARAGVQSRFTYWAVVELLKKDRDERVRAAAVLAASHLEPGRFHQEMYLLRKDSSPLVRAALANGLAVVHDSTAVKSLTRLIDSDDPDVRQAAARSLLQRKEEWARKALAARIDHGDTRVRLAAVRASADVDALAGLLGDPSPEVRSAAFGSIVRVRGQAATLQQFARAIADSPPASTDRALWATTWLAPR